MFFPFSVNMELKYKYNLVAWKQQEILLMLMRLNKEGAIFSHKKNL